MPTKHDSEALMPDDRAIDFQKLFHSLLEHKLIIFLCFLAALGLGAAYIIRTPKTYESTTVVQVEQSENKLLKIDDFNTQDLKQIEVLKTIEANFTNPTLLIGVVQSLKLTSESFNMKPKDDGTAPSEMELAEVLSKSVSAKLMRGTRLISITAGHTNPLMAQQIADQVVKEYEKSNTAQRADVSNEASKFLIEEAERLKAQLRQSEDEAQAFKDQHPEVGLENSQNFIDQKLLALNSKLNEAKETRFKLQSDYNQVQALLASGAGNKSEAAKVNQLLTIPSVTRDPTVIQLQKSVSDGEAALQQLGERYRAKHPKYIQAQAQLASFRNTLAQATFSAAEAVGTAVEAARQTEANFEKDLKAAEEVKLAGGKLSIPFSALQSEVDSNRQLYEAVKMRLKETQVTREIGSSTIRVINAARFPLKPTKPRKLVALAASAMGGIMLGICAALAVSAIDTSLRSVDAVEESIGLPVLAAVPVTTAPQGKNRYLITEDLAGTVAEAFRTLRTSFSLEAGAAEPKKILFTSSIPGEGKSFCAVNYAISLSQLGQRTLIIDADLRKPTVGKTLLGKNAGNGLQTVLSGKTTFEESVFPAKDISNLFVVPSGTRVANPAELLGGKLFSDYLEDASKRYDYVVVDSAPVHAVSDTLMMIKHVQAVCFVIQAGKTPAKVAQRACLLLEKAGFSPTGVVLNRVSQQGSNYYYSYTGGKYGEGVYGETADESA